MGGYATTPDYEDFLRSLIEFHESDNVMSHIKKHEIVKGDVVDTVPRFMDEHPEIIIALAFFDLALYEPTKVCLEAIAPRLVKGSVLAFDELNAPEYPGESEALVETLGLRCGEIRRSKFLPDRSYIVIE